MSVITDKSRNVEYFKNTMGYSSEIKIKHRKNHHQHNPKSNNKPDKSQI